MELTQILLTRRSINRFLNRPVPRERLRKLVDNARYSPSAINVNPWRFVIITEKNTLERLSETHPYCRWLAAAPAGIVIAVDPSSTRYWLEDCCIAAYSIWLAAVDAGLSAAWGALYQSDNPAESERRQKYVREVLSIPDTLSVPMVLAIGYSNESPAEKKRPAIKDIVHWERYGEKDSA